MTATVLRGMEDPRVEEYRSARLAVMKGLSAPAGARERYRKSIGPYLDFCSGFCPEDSPARRPYMAALAYGHEEDRGPEIPIVAIIAAFRATEQDAEFIHALKPVYAPEPTSEQERLRELAKRNYRAYLQTDHWKRVRTAALQRAQFICQGCNTPGGHGTVLEVHHRHYDRCGAERPLDVKVLCSNCHADHHGQRRSR